MPRKVDDLECIFCGEAPCVCNKMRLGGRSVAKKDKTEADLPPVTKAPRAPREVKPEKRSPEPVALVEKPVPHRRLSALDRMRAAAPRPAVATAPTVPDPAPVAPAAPSSPPVTNAPAGTDAEDTPEVLDPVIQVAISNLLPLLGSDHVGAGRESLRYRASLWKERREK